MNSFIKNAIPHIVALGVFLAVAIGFFPDAMKAKVASQPDRILAAGKENEIVKHREQTGEESLWTNQIFGGMPAFYGGVKYRNNVLRQVYEYVLTLNLPDPSSFFFLSFICGYILLILLGINPWLSIIGALSMGLCTYNFVIYEAGHISKLHAIAYFPLVAAGVLLAYRGKYILGTVLFGFAFGLEIMTSHIQMTYYLGLGLLVYVIIRFIYALKNGELPSFIKASALLSLAALLAIGANASRLWSSYDYMKESIRGPKILKQADNGKDNKQGLGKDYVFNWSYGIGESMTFLIPGFFGGASSEGIDSNSATYKDLKRKGANRAALKTAPLYWGAQPMTSGPVYFGAIMCFLFVLGLIVVKGELKWWLLFATLLTLLLSWGKNLQWFSDIFYYYFPLYNKFRAVSSILVVPQLTIPLLGVLGLSAITQNDIDKSKALRALYIAAAVTGGLCLLFALMGPSFFDFSAANDARYKQAGYNIGAFVSDRKSLMRSDAFRSLLFIALSAGLIWFYLNEKITFSAKKWLVFGGLGVLTLVDLGGVGARYLNSDNFVSKGAYQRNFAQRSVDKQILKDKDPNFRVLDMSINTFNSNKATYHHKTIGGYHAVKLRRYQDMIENHIGKGNQKVLNMLNTKYIIGQEKQAQQNPGAMGNVWFVNNIQKVATPNEEIDALNNIDPKTTAIVHQEFDNYLGGFSGGNGQGTIKLADYKPNHLTYETNSSAEQLAVFSEVWYDPGQGKGWQAYIDGQEVEHIRANYVLRAIKVPAGQHKIEFKFFPRAYYMGETISLISSLILLLSFVGYLVWEFLQARKRSEVEEEQKTIVEG